MDYKDRFGDRLSELLINHEITVSILADKLGMSVSDISRYKDDKMSIKLSKAVLIADYFNCSLEFLFGHSDKILDFSVKVEKSFYGRLLAIIEERKITRYKVIKDLKKSKSHFNSWKKGGDPFIDTVIEFANYFGVTLDFLAGRES